MAKKNVWLGILAMALVFIGFNGCVSNIDWYKMELDSNLPGRSQVLNLKNTTRENELYQQAERIASKGFFDSNGETYGYYTIDLRINRDIPPSYWVYLTVNSLLSFVPPILGVPCDAAKFTLTAYLNIFDSNGELVRTFNKRDSFVQTAGIYYGHNPTPKAGKKYSRLYEALFEEANTRAGEINPLLQAAGPVTIEKSSKANSKIAGFKQEG